MYCSELHHTCVAIFLVMRCTSKFLFHFDGIKVENLNQMKKVISYYKKKVIKKTMCDCIFKQNPKMIYNTNSSL